MKANFPGGVFSRCSRAGTARKSTKTCAALANLLQTYCFLPFSLPSPACERVNQFEKGEQLGSGAGASSGQRITLLAHALQRNHFVIVD